MAPKSNLKILYLVPNLCDAAVAKRVAMLSTGGATVAIAGFRRTEHPIESAAVDFGQTYNGGFMQRTWSVLKQLFSLGQHKALFADADIILARNLEMLAIAVRGRSLCQKKLLFPLPLRVGVRGWGPFFFCSKRSPHPGPPPQGGREKKNPTIVYECLDIHRLLLESGPVSTGLRILETWFLKKTSAIITSSPAFISEYFKGILPIKLIENKVYPARSTSDSFYRNAIFPVIPSVAEGSDAQDPSATLGMTKMCRVESSPAIPASPRTAGPPWKIGWFGMIRCRESLAILTELVKKSEGKVEVIIRGRPSFDQFDDFNKLTASTPGLQFLGPYNYPDDLAAIYREVHFVWAIDKFEDGLNSSWLLPNRLYEGGLFAAVPIALKDVETGRTIERLGIGRSIPTLSAESLHYYFNLLTAEKYHSMEQKVSALPPSTWSFSDQDCAELVAWLGTIHGA